MFLRCEQKGSYDAWFPNWYQTLSEDERKLLKFGNAQRVAAVHKQGAETQSDIEMVPLTQFEPEYNPNSIRCVTCGWFDSPGIPPPEMGLMVYYFEIEGKKENAVNTCKRYLALLETLVREFDQAFP